MKWKRSNALTPELVAQMCHRNFQLISQYLGQKVSPNWEELSEWEKETKISGIEAMHGCGSEEDPRAYHDSWLIRKLLDGWKYGPEKNVAKKEHPSILPYSKLEWDDRHLVECGFYAKTARPMISRFGMHTREQRERHKQEEDDRKTQNNS